MAVMSGSNTTGGENSTLAGKDLNKDGKVVNLVISGNSRFYDYEWLEDQLDQWIGGTTTDLIICGGASGLIISLKEGGQQQLRLQCLLKIEAQGLV